MSSNNGMNNLGVSAAVAESVGRRLRESREARKLSTGQVAQKIRVREHYLVAIENADWNVLPPGLNGRGLVRLYGRELQVALPELDPVGGNPQAGSAETVDFQVQTRPATPQDRIAGNTRGSVGPSHSRGRDRVGTPPPPSSAPRSQAVPLRREGPSLRSVPPVPAMNDEEAPLDVVTPDLAAILGLNAEDFGEPKRDAAGGVPLPEPERIPDLGRAAAADADDIPQVSADELARGMFDRAPEQSSSPSAILQPRPAAEPRSQVPSSKFPRESKAERQRRKASERAQRAQSQPPSSAPASPDGATGPQRNDASSFRLDAPDSQPPPVAPQFTAEKTIAIPTAVIESQPPLSHVPLSEAPSGGGMPPRQGKERRWLIPALASVGALLLVAIVYISQHEEEDSQAAIPTAAPIVVSVTQAGGDPANEVNVIASGESIGDGVPAAPHATPSAAATRAVVPPAATKAAATPSSAAQPSAAVAATTAPVVQPVATAAPAAAATAAATPEANAAPVAAKGLRVARLEVSEDVGLQATADGKVVLNGRSTPGTYAVEFKTSAEIFVDDGSKVKLSYEGWEHGPLGQPGRRRRIILNAQPYGAQP